MWQLVRDYPAAVFLSVLAHVLLVGVMVIGVERSLRDSPQVQAEPIEAVIVDEEEILREVERLKQLEEERKSQQQQDLEAKEALLKELEQNRLEEEERLRAAQEEQEKQLREQQAKLEEFERNRAEEEAKAQERAQQLAMLSQRGPPQGVADDDGDAEERDDGLGQLTRADGSDAHYRLRRPDADGVRDGLCSLCAHNAGGGICARFSFAFADGHTCDDFGIAER